MSKKTLYHQSKKTNGDCPLRGIIWTTDFLKEIKSLINLELFDNIICQRIDLLQTPEIFPEDDENPTCRVFFIEENENLPSMKILFRFSDEVVILISVKNFN